MALRRRAVGARDIIDSYPGRLTIYMLLSSDLSNKIRKHFIFSSWLFNPIFTKLH